ncbi:efflux RND transporter periplasmic adaptor subunit [Pseudidiomarina sp. 1APP75-32.1]|uniref:Efflux RND transporter periplasmic adaptor subunit n=2 Tax=Pseudidiomarina terrestris TaxID=2820060 RepID=A0AAW7QVK6_9GAMM|nr:efflux RND transporter periplasmic adaptor subunit [Pseudidiomarina sp. 1APP75-32.1]MDN7127682.1 efflux RND transporter periplasmic adaptor subunit [Pseudidiomarina sp. 1APR75-33.1]MDN7136351.1 efflux RND transporter periplasmic adaptor subunit [Pseudidiomarina sp. 1ASP75-5]
MTFKKRALLPPIIILVAVALVMALSMLRPQLPMRAKERPAVLVEVQQAEPESINLLVSGQGNVMPKQTTNLIAQVSGQVIETATNFHNGGFFKKGDMLLKIDSRDYEVALQNAKANLAQAKAALAEESARAEVAREEWESLQLGEIPDLGLRKPQVASAVAAMQSAEAAVAKAQRDLDRTIVRAPFDGVLQSKGVDLGQYVNVGSQIAQMMGTEVAEVRVPLSDRDLAYLNLPEAGQTADFPEVRLTSQVAGQNYFWQGKLVRSEGVLDSSSRVIYGVVEVRDPYNRNGQSHEHILRFGRFVALEIEGIFVENVYRIPRYALTADGNVWLVGEDRRLQRTHVEVLRAEENQVIVSEGLNPGDTVVLTQLSNALPSMKVRLPGDPLPEQMEGSGDSNESNAVNSASSDSSADE